jgi:SAM-dependent methyltransferase
MKNFLLQLWLQPWFPRNAIRAILIQYYKLRGEIPWNLGFVFYKWKYINGVLDSEQQMKLFAEDSELPSKFGRRIDERVVEFPWLFTRLSTTGAQLLDAGSALNYEEIVTRLANYGKDITILTLTPEREAFWEKGISYHYEDLRDLPFRDGWFDEITCISTLEHVGMDNLNYGDSAQAGIQSDDFQMAGKELWRVLKPDGKLLITVPFGRRQNVLWNDVIFMQQFDEELLQKLSYCFAGGAINTWFYKYEADGWKLSTLEACRDVEYFNVHEASAPADDFAAAARAVACLEIQKTS